MEELIMELRINWVRINDGNSSDQDWKLVLKYSKNISGNRKVTTVIEKAWYQKFCMRTKLFFFQIHLSAYTCGKLKKMATRNEKQKKYWIPRMGSH
ncbi:hypothetical protein RUM44_001206 [Polyplax serrata]|uniref:Uncharacterized protein n=1 Tax=Polyplax serrata TaxID=468196 RepID=A0ABR1B7T6_POLSC